MSAIRPGGIDDSQKALSLRPTFNVSELPASVLDHRSAVWIGNILMIIIESLMFALLFATYFYLRNNFQVWPPPQVNRSPMNLHPLPGLGFTSINMIWLVLSIIPMFVADRACLHMKESVAKICLLVLLVMIAVAIVLRFYEFKDVRFRWDDNAYSAVLWTTLSVHLMHLCIAFGEMMLMTVWIFVKGMDAKHSRDVRVTAIYWYWVVGVWVPFYLAMFVGPHLL